MLNAITKQCQWYVITFGPLYLYKLDANLGILDVLLQSKLFETVNLYCIVFTLKINHRNHVQMLLIIFEKLNTGRLVLKKLNTLLSALVSKLNIGSISFSL